MSAQISVAVRAGSSPVTGRRQSFLVAVQRIGENSNLGSSPGQVRHDAADLDAVAFVGDAGRGQMAQQGEDRLGGEVLVDVVPTEIAHGGWAAGNVGYSDLGLGAGAQLGQGPAGGGDVHGHLSQGEHVAEPQPGQPGLRVVGIPQSLIGVVQHEGHPRGG